MGRRRLIDDEKLQELYRQGMPLKQIGEALGVSSVACHKRIRKLNLTKLPKSVESLTEKERNFCLAVVGGKSRINACMATYDVTSRESAKALQQTLMKNPAIRTSINDLMEAGGVGKVFRVEKLAEHMQSRDEMIALKALDMGMKIADDAGERTPKEPDEWWKSNPFDINLVATVHKFDRRTNECAICRTAGFEPFCTECLSKYPVLTEKLVRHWNGDVCAGCLDEMRCLEYCLSCKKKKELENITI